MADKSAQTRYAVNAMKKSFVVIINSRFQRATESDAPYRLL